LTAGNGESSAVLFELKKSADELTIVCGDSSASNVQSSGARDRFTFVPFRSKENSYQFIANGSEFTAVLGRFIASDDELEESKGRLEKNDDESVALLFRIPFVRDESSTSGGRFTAFLFRSFASDARFSDDDRRMVAGGRGVSTKRRATTSSA
jgi:hypothetical protein